MKLATSEINIAAHLSYELKMNQICSDKQLTLNI